MMGTFDEWQAQKDSQYILAVDYLEQLAKRHDSTIEATANHLIHCDSLKEIYEKSDNGEYYPAYEPTGYGYYDNDTPPPRIQFLESAKANTDTTGKILSKDFYRMWDNNYFKKSELPAIEPVEPNEPRKNNNEIIAEIVAKADIVKIIGKHVELKRSGNDFKGCCPFHGEKTPSFFISPKKGLYNCFGCGVSGNALTFLKDYEGMTAGEALKELSRQTGIGLPNQDNETKLLKVPYKNEKKPFNSIASFITSYNLPQVTALILGINFEHLTVHENNTYIDQNECPQEKVLQFDRLLQSLVIMAKNGNLQGIAVTFYTPYSFNHVLTTPPKQEFDYLNSVIDKDNLEKYLKSIGKDLSQLLELQEPLTAPTPQTDSQLLQQVADQQATIDQQAKELTNLKTQIEEVTKQKTSIDSLYNISKILFKSEFTSLLIIFTISGILLLNFTKLNEKDKFVYIYDFCDHWLHEIQVMKIFEPKKTFYPKCIKGAMNRPPEDCGGILGFENFKEIMGNRKHPKFKEMKTWYGGMYDEELFLKYQINEDFNNFDTIVEEMLLDLDD